MVRFPTQCAVELSNLCLNISSQTIYCRIYAILLIHIAICYTESQLQYRSSFPYARVHLIITSLGTSISMIHSFYIQFPLSSSCKNRSDHITFSSHSALMPELLFLVKVLLLFLILRYHLYGSQQIYSFSFIMFNKCGLYLLFMLLLKPHHILADFLTVKRCQSPELVESHSF